MMITELSIAGILFTWGVIKYIKAGYTTEYTNAIIGSFGFIFSIGLTYVTFGFLIAISTTMASGVTALASHNIGVFIDKNGLPSLTRIHHRITTSVPMWDKSR